MDINIQTVLGVLGGVDHLSKGAVGIVDDDSDEVAL